MQNIYSQIGLSESGKNRSDEWIAIGQHIAQDFLVQVGIDISGEAGKLFLSTFDPHAPYPRLKVPEVAPLFYHSQHTTDILSTYLLMISHIDDQKRGFLATIDGSDEEKNVAYSDFLVSLTTEAYRRVFLSAGHDMRCEGLRRNIATIIDPNNATTNPTKNTYTRFMDITSDILESRYDGFFTGLDAPMRLSVMLYWCLRVHFSGRPIVG